MSDIVSKTPTPPYYAVIFTSARTENNDGYSLADEKMFELVKQHPGFLGAESFQQGKNGITISYWSDQDVISKWKQHLEHLRVQQLGKDKWYKEYSVRVCRVERDYFFTSEA